MPEQVNGVIDAVSDAIGGRVANVGADSKPTDNGAARTYDPEIITGYPTEEPVTERIDATGDTGSSDGYRRTRTGAIDRRSLRGKRGKYNTGDGTTPSKESIPVSSLSFGDLLFGIHGFLSEATKTPELKLEREEAEKLGKATSDLAACYGHVVNPKVAAWIQLGMVCAAVYGPRVAAVSVRQKFEARERKLKVTSITNGHAANHKPEPEPLVPPEPMERSGEIH